MKIKRTPTTIGRRKFAASTVVALALTTLVLRPTPTHALSHVGTYFLESITVNQWVVSHDLSGCLITDVPISFQHVLSPTAEPPTRRTVQSSDAVIARGETLSMSISDAPPGAIVWVSATCKRY